MSIDVDRDKEFFPAIKKIMDKLKRLDEKSDKNMESINYKFKLVFEELKEIKKKVK